MGGLYRPSPNPSRLREGLDETREAHLSQRTAHRAVDDAPMRLHLAIALERAIVAPRLDTACQRDRSLYRLVAFGKVHRDRNSDVSGKSVTVRVLPVGRLIINNTQTSSH